MEAIKFDGRMFEISARCFGIAFGVVDTKRERCQNKQLASSPNSFDNSVLIPLNCVSQSREAQTARKVVGRRLLITHPSIHSHSRLHGKKNTKILIVPGAPLGRSELILNGIKCETIKCIPFYDSFLSSSYWPIILPDSGDFALWLHTNSAQLASWCYIESSESNFIDSNLVARKERNSEWVEINGWAENRFLYRLIFMFPVNENSWTGDSMKEEFIDV